MELDEEDLIEALTAASGDLSADTPEGDPEAHLPPWPIRQVTPGLKRCAIPDAGEIDILFSDLLLGEPDPWAEADLDVKTGILEALDGATPLFLVADSDGLTPHYGRVTVTRGAARLVLWEGGGSVCEETIAATTADALLNVARERAQRLVAAFPTRPDVEAELAERFGAPDYPWAPDPTRRCRKHRGSATAPRRCAACQAKRKEVAATARRLRLKVARELNMRIAAGDRTESG